MSVCCSGIVLSTFPKNCRNVGVSAQTNCVSLSANFKFKRANRSPVGMVELLDQPATVGQSDLNVSDGLRGVEGHRGTGLGLVGSLVLLGGGRSWNQLWGGTREGGKRRSKEKDQNLLWLDTLSSFGHDENALAQAICKIQNRVVLPYHLNIWQDVTSLFFLLCSGVQRTIV